ncbi:MAG: patatin-like phospholipase family protein [Myxococcaceae bacterium]|nr:patatin-like phospholipase family protein [Myxococcaceae bacterium]MCI0671571.1 patatin-like phospholipase family protein [Myxococcaceae bacterium]
MMETLEEELAEAVASAEARGTRGQVAARGSLGRLALAFSGGGYRAAAYHLGTLALLHRVGLLEDVRALSTVSGGTLTGCAWALALARGEPFPAFARRFHAWLAQTDAVEEAIVQLRGPPPSTPSKRRSLITAAATVYARPDFLGEERFGTLVDTVGPLEELCFNATEFHTGTAFRFQVSAAGPAKVGNGRVHIPLSLAREVRLADIVAASSCFPGGFEPLHFPDDFVWQTPGQRPGTGLEEVPEGLALMDGGIYDNQGIGSLLHAQARGAGLALLVVSDTDVQTDEALFRFERPPPPGGLTFGTAFRLGVALVVACWASAVVLTLDLVARLRAPDGVGLLALLRTGLPLVLTAGLGVGLPWLWRTLRDRVRASFPGKAERLWRYLKGLPIPEAAELVDLRLRSLMAMVARVFMKRVRGLGYAMLYEDGSFDERPVASLIYTLPRAHAREGRRGVPAWLLPSEVLLEVTRQAVAMDTTLWFDDPAQLRALVAAGQATLCHQLLAHLHSRHGEGEETQPEAARPLYRALREVWAQAQSAPLTLGEPLPLTEVPPQGERGGISASATR